MSEHLAKMVRMAADPAATLDELRQRSGRPALLVAPLYFPRELLDAADFIAAEIWGAELPLRRSGEFLQPTICSLMVGLFELGLAGRLEGIAGAVFPSTCDTVQNSEGIWASRFPGMFVGHVVMPKVTSAPGAAEFLRAQMREFLDALATRFDAKIDDQALSAAIKRGNAARAAARKLLDLGRQGLLSAAERHAICTLYALLPFAEFTALAARAADELAGRKPLPGARLLVSGMLLGPAAVVGLYDELGALIVEDDLGIGRRSLDPDVSEQGDPLTALAQRQLARRPCCTIHHDGRDRAAHLVAEARAAGAQGVVFSRLKFCDPESFDYPHLSGSIKAAGLPSLLLEIELGATGVEAITTRMQAFLESLT